VEVSGTLTDSNGQGLPGVSVFVKGSTVGTITDQNGNYRLIAPYNGVLVFQAVGFRSQEVPVSQVFGTLNESAIKEEIATDTTDFDFQRFVNDTLTPEKGGVGVLDNKTPHYRFQENVKDLSKGIPIAKIVFKKRRLWPFRQGIYVIKNGPPIFSNKKEHWGINFSNSLKLNSPNRLPNLQDQFAQGRLNTWQGPETGEIFSWGPLMRLLEFDGQSYAYDRNGALTGVGNGNGTPAINYDSYDFFRNAFSLDNLLQVSFEKRGQSFFFKFQQNRQNFIIPQTSQKQTNLALNANHNLGNVKLKWNVSYIDGDSQLPQRGANWQRILSSVMRTPPSFDNANGLLRNEALKNESTYLLNNNIQRSHSPNLSDNPFFLVNSMPDNADYQRFITSFGLEHSFSNWRIDYQIGYENQHNFNRFGLAEKSAGAELGRLTERNEDLNHFTTRVNLNYDNKRNKYDSFLYNWEIGFQYLLDFENRLLNRTDQNFLSANLISLNLGRERWRNELNVNTKFKFLKDKLQVNTSNQIYLSSTLSGGNNVFFLPSLNVRVNPILLIDDYVGEPLNNLQLFFSYNKTVNEASLLANNWQYNSLIYSINDYLQYYESAELPFNFGLDPERKRKTDAGLKVDVFWNLNFAVNTFREITKDLITPVFADNRFQWQNVAELMNRGWEMSLIYNTRRMYYSDIEIGFDLHFTHYNPTVRRLNNNFNRVPLAGYQEVSTNLVEGKPFGTIVGSAYLRNSEGQLIIDNEGFPLVNPELQVIGNPNPDWILNGEGRFRWKDLNFSFVLEYREGGQIWNGTQNVLNYLGRSQLTANQRNTSNYVFEGIRLDNSPNTTPVDFANPARGLNQNRWVRYGLSGVAEDAIQNASWFRLSEVKISYNFKEFLKKKKIKADLRLSVFAQNWLLNTAYQGVDPFTSLMGYSQAQGLDLFNAPNLRSIGMQIQVKL
jgi:hypothetical protein